MVHHPAGESICTDDSLALISIRWQHSLTKNTFTVIWAVTFALSSMKITPVLPYAKRQQKPSRCASNKGRKLKYQHSVIFWHTLYIYMSYATKNKFSLPAYPGLHRHAYDWRSRSKTHCALISQLWSTSQLSPSPVMTHTRTQTHTHKHTNRTYHQQVYIPTIFTSYVS